VPGRPPGGNGEAKGLGIDWMDGANDGVTDGEGLWMICLRILSHLAREGDAGSGFTSNRSEREGRVSRCWGFIFLCLGGSSSIGESTM